MQRSTLAKRAWLLFFPLAVAFYLYGLGRHPFIGPDEPRYAEVAREMFMRGDLVTPTLGGQPGFEKPALLYWIEMLSFGAFGVSERAARFGAACAGLMAALIIYRMGRRVEQESDGVETRWLGRSSGVALACSIGLIGFSRGVNFDILLTLTVTAALCLFFASGLETDEKRRRWLLAGCYVMIGASLLAKGLVGIVLPGGIVAVYLLLRREWPDRVLRWSTLWGIPLALIVAAVWYAPATARHGWPFIDQFFIQHHFARFVSNKYHHPQPFYFYLLVLPLMVFPWTVFLATSLCAAPRWSWRAPTASAKLRVFAFAWLVVPVVFFSFSRSKLPGYILPALPGAALLIGDQLASALRHEDGSRAIRMTGALLFMLAVVEVIYAFHVGFIPTTCALLIATPLGVAGALILLLPHLRRMFIVLTTCAVFGASALAINCALGQVASRESTRDLLQRASSRGYGAAPVFHMYTVEHTTSYYAAGRLAYGADGEPLRYDGAAEVADAARRNGSPILVFIPKEYAAQLTEYNRIETEVIGDNGVIALVAVRAR